MPAAEAKKEEVLDVGKSIDQLITSYPKLNTGAPSSWFYANQETFETHFGHVCHAQMCYATKDKWDDLYTAVVQEDEMGIAYTRMLIHGPFKAYSDLIGLEQHGKHYVLHVTDLDKIPANVLYNFCVASRVPIEHKQLIEPWYKGVELGYDPTLSFLLSYSTNGKPFVKGKPRTFNGDANQTNHFWFYPTADWMRIIKGDVTDLSKDFKAHPGDCRPTNQIWGTAHYREKFQKLTAEEISEAMGLPIEPPAADPVKPAARPKKAKPHPGHLHPMFLNMEHLIQPQQPDVALQNQAQLLLQPVGWQQAVDQILHGDGQWLGAGAGLHIENDVFGNEPPQPLIHDEGPIDFDEPPDHDPWGDEDVDEEF